MDDSHEGRAARPREAPAGGGVPRTRRDAMLLVATLAGADGGGVSLRVRNLSAGGLMADAPPAAAGFAAGAAVRVDLRQIGRIEARIAWLRDGRIGLEFAAPIDPQAVRRANGRVETPPVNPPPVSTNAARPGLRRG